MNTLTEDDFFRWAETVGIGLDERYPHSGCLAHRTYSNHRRFWVLPPDPEAWPSFVSQFLQGMDPWTHCYVWPRHGRWPNSKKSQYPTEGVRDITFRGAGVPDGWEGAVRFNQDEKDAVIAITFVQLAFGWSTPDDLFIIPDHGRQLIQTDHHDVVHVTCLDEERALRFVEFMSDAGYELPTDVPDRTFRRPSWMPPASDEQS